MTASDTFGTDVTATDTAGVDVIHPAITITKTADTAQVVSGATATFTIVVENTGDVDLANVEVTDAVAPLCDTTIGTLVTGATFTISCTLSGRTADYVNTATVTADAPVGPPLSASDTASIDIINPSFTVDQVGRHALPLLG